MSGEFKARQRFERRMLVFQLAAMAFAGILLFHLFDMQWLQHEKFALQAERNRINIIPVLPTRGEILDRNEKKLALNKIAYRLEMIPERVDQPEQMIQSLGDMLGWDPKKRERLLKRVLRARADRPVLLDDKLQWKDIAPVAARLHHLPGIDVHASTYRYYPYAELTSHLVGYLSLANQQDIEAGFLPSEFVGRSGVEASFEELLHGVPGSQQEEVDAFGRRVAVVKRSPPQKGEDLQLSLDVDIQKAASNALGKRTGAVVVLDVESGDVITMLSKPGYDTNRFITGLETEQWQQWLNDPRKPLLNRATQAAYPPASTFKLLAAMAGLREHIPLATGHTFCPGYLELADRKLRCWKRSGHQQIDLHQAIVESCDVYFYELGDALGMRRLSDEAQAWGFGEKTGINLPPEARGIVPARHPYLMPAKFEHSTGRRRQWYRGETMIAAIGQGAITVTPLQMARLAAALANGGKILRPKLLKQRAPEVVRSVHVQPRVLQRIRKAMYDVVNTPKGTAYMHLRDLPWSVAGKTGTAQVVAMASDEDARDVPDYDAHKDHAWFMGFTPYEHPRFAFAVFVEHGGHGGSAAAPVAGALVRVLAEKFPLDDQP